MLGKSVENQQSEDGIPSQGHDAIQDLAKKVPSIQAHGKLSFTHLATVTLSATVEPVAEGHQAFDGPETHLTPGSARKALKRKTSFRETRRGAHLEILKYCRNNRVRLQD